MTGDVRSIPKAALAGLLIVAAARLIDVERLRYIIRGSRYDAAPSWLRNDMRKQRFAPPSAPPSLGAPRH